MTQNIKKNKINITNISFWKSLRLPTIIQFILGMVSVVTVIVITILAWPALPAGHPAYPILLGVIFIIGIILLVLCTRPKKKGKLRMVGRIVGVIILVLSLAMVIYLRPFPANATGIASTTSTESVEVVERWDSWELHSTGETNNVGIVFLPGMLVDSRAYLPLLIPIAEQGAVVIIPKAPLGMVINGAQTVDKAIESNPYIDTWIVGGHSMGGAVATSVAESNSDIDGLLIWASYSMQDMSNSDVEVVSIYGTNDPFADEKIINDTKEYLPTKTQYVEIQGGIHEYFGDYTQPGDGNPDIDRASAEQQIINETLTFVESLKQKRD